jgi:hypothetical protein
MADTPMKEIAIPAKLAPLVKAFSADEQAARLLIIEAARAIGQAEPSSGFDLGMYEEKSVSEAEISGIVAMMKDIDPKDTLEMIYGAQIVSSHLMGLRLLSHRLLADQNLGLKLLRFSNEAMAQLLKKRAGGVNQNISITYNNAGPGPALMQTVVNKD